MSRKDKLIDSLKNSPKNIKFETLQGILMGLGFRERQPKGGSSHYTYISGEYRITIPRHQPVNEVYVKQVVKIIDELSKEDDSQ